MKRLATVLIALFALLALIMTAQAADKAELTPAEKSEPIIGTVYGTCGKTDITTLPKISAVPGDMDGSSAVNMKDLLLLRQHLAGGYGVTITASVADLDHNGSVNMRDLLLFRQYLAGGYGVELTPPPSGGQPLDDNSTPWIPAP